MTNKNKFSQEERQAFYNAIINLDPEKVFVVADKENDALSYTDKIKSYEKITGTPRDEELTRALILLHLIKTSITTIQQLKLKIHLTLADVEKKRQEQLKQTFA